MKNYGYRSLGQDYSEEEQDIEPDDDEEALYEGLDGYENLGKVVRVLGNVESPQQAASLKKRKRSFYPTSLSDINWPLLILGGVVTGGAAWGIRYLLTKLTGQKV